METIYYIYHIYKPEDEGQYDKGYIGIINNPQRRKNTHLRLLKDNCHYNPHLQNAYNKYGNLEFKILLVTNYDHALYLESQFRPNKRIGLNISPGGMTTVVNKAQSIEVKLQRKYAANNWLSNPIKRQEAYQKRMITLQENKQIKINSLEKRNKTIQLKKQNGWKYKKPSPFIYIIDGKFYEYAEDAYKEHNISKTTLHLRCTGMLIKIDKQTKKKVKVSYNELGIEDTYPTWDRIER